MEIPKGAAFCTSCGAPATGMTDSDVAQQGFASPSMGASASGEVNGSENSEAAGQGLANPSPSMGAPVTGEANGNTARQGMSSTSPSAGMTGGSSDSATTQTDQQSAPVAEKKKRFCTRCGKEIPDGAAFCTSCGAPASGGANGAQQGYAGTSPQVTSMPWVQLKTDRSLLKMVLLSLVTLGIYGIVVMSSVSNDINTIASRYDNKRTMHYCLLSFVVMPLTLGIGGWVWYHKISARIGTELQRRGIDFKFGASTFWLWGVLGSFIIVGPFMYSYKLLTAMNLLSEDYNCKGR